MRLRLELLIRSSLCNFCGIGALTHSEDVMIFRRSFKQEVVLLKEELEVLQNDHSILAERYTRIKTDMVHIFRLLPFLETKQVTSADDERIVDLQAQTSKQPCVEKEVAVAEQLRLLQERLKRLGKQERSEK